MPILDAVRNLEWVGLVAVGLATGAIIWRNASRRPGQRNLRYAKALICFAIALVYTLALLNWIDATALALYARPLLLMLLLSLFGREWLERLP